MSENNAGNSKCPTNPNPNLTSDQIKTRDDGLRILARMIVRAYMRDLKKKHLAKLGIRPRFFVDRINIVLDSVDVNNPKDRQRLHQIIDEAIDEAVRQDLPEKSPPLVLSRNDIRVRIYC